MRSRKLISLILITTVITFLMACSETPSTTREVAPVVSTKQVPVAIELPTMIPVQPTSTANPIATATPELTSTSTMVIPEASVLVAEYQFSEDGDVVIPEISYIRESLPNKDVLIPGEIRASSKASSTRRPLPSPTLTPEPTPTHIPIPSPTLESRATPRSTATTVPPPSTPHLFEVLNRHPTIECLNENMNVFINVFGVYVISNHSFAPGHAMHTANILAEYIDNNMDGAPDDDDVLNHLIEQNYVVPVWTTDIRGQFWEDARGTFCEDNISMAASMYDDDDWAIGGIKHVGRFDANLEEVWHVVSRGWYAAYPEYFGNSFEEDSLLTQAMDIARGGKFDETPSEYPAAAWYKYDDESCTYQCQIAEYFYWAVAANIGALDTRITNKCFPGKTEWSICTKSELKEKDSKIYDLLNNMGFNLPANIPLGGYKLNTD